MDSLYNASGSTFAFPRDLNLNDMFFKYGFRINPLSKTNKEALWQEGGKRHTVPVEFKFAPLVYPRVHLIVKI
jgi:hypothetical protein